MRARGYAGNGGTGDYGRQQTGSGVGEAVGHMGAALGQVGRQASSAVAQGVQDVTGTAGDILEGASGLAADIAHTAAGGVSQAAHTVTDSVSALAGRAQTGAKRVERTFERQLQDRPLAIGAAAVAIGTMVGCALPRTRTEDELMGEARESMLSRAGDAVQEVAEAVGLRGEHAGETSQSRQASQGDPRPSERSSSEQRSQPGQGQQHQRPAGKQQSQGSQSGQGKQSGEHGSSKS
jgi:hypothetical protein